MSKYIIEIKPEYEDKFKGVMILGAENSNLYVDSQTVDELEELNSDYINEHFSDLQDTAYQRGLDDAWEAARKIAYMWNDIDDDELLAIFGITERIDYSTINTLFGKQTASEAIEKLKAYEEKQKADEKIEVGDEVVDSSGKKGLVVSDGNKCSDTIWLLINGYRVPQSVYKEDYTKTGRHFDIASILEDMSHD